MNITPSIQPFIDQVIQWASEQSAILAVALVGSYARGAGTPESDVDLVLLTAQPEYYIHNTDWTGRFGAIERIQVENYGRVTSVRVWYQNDLEVEFGLALPDWAALPLDAGTQRVMLDGIKILFERQPLLTRALAALQGSPE